VIVLHEKDWAKRLRNLLYGNFAALQEPSARNWIKKFYPELKGIPIKSYWHHETHAAAGVLTSDFDECAVMVIDAIGEFDCSTIWHWKGGKLKKLKSMQYPHSLGLFYSAVTAHVGLKPMEDEYILMGMAAYGDPERSNMLARHLQGMYFKHGLKMCTNLQKGIPRTDFTLRNEQDKFDLARAAQIVMENKLHTWAAEALHLTKSTNLVYMGGCALNCVANNLLYKFFDNVHIMPNPGDAGSSLGAAAWEYYQQTGQRVEWQGPYTGHEIEGPYPVERALESLFRNEIFGIANGRAEFGPRALGNRSLMADPRGGDIKDRLNEIKKRQKFRPFAPVILEEKVHNYFDVPEGFKSPYMQFVAKCLYPEAYPAIVHADGTSRVQTVNEQDHPELYRLLKAFMARTGCPMLVNTSLNIKGQPIVNDVHDAFEFAERYGIEVHTSDYE
jgi:carbamoyltransferase